MSALKNQGYFIPYSVNSGRYNMDMDERLLDYAVAENLKSPILRFYGWSPACVSLGRNQSGTQIKRDFCKENSIDIVKRLTGGRALLHDKELTYSFICPASFLKNGETVLQSYKEISGALALGFNALGLEVNFPAETKAKTKFEYCMSLSTGADLSYQGKKIVGSAQFRKQGYILQHGSIMYEYNENVIEKVFGEKPLSDKIAVLNELLQKIDENQLCEVLKSGFEEYFDTEFTKTLTALSHNQ